MKTLIDTTAVAVICVPLAFSGCGTVPNAVNTASPSPSVVTSASAASASPSATAGPGLATLVDATSGFSFNYPATWIDVSARRSDPPGSHEIASEIAISSPLEIGMNGWWLYARVYKPDSSIECGLPTTWLERSDSYLGGVPAPRFVVKGWQADPSAWVITVIAQRSGECVELQQYAGGGISEQSALGQFAQIQQTFAFSS